jgi:hypothetical protein
VPLEHTFASASPAEVSAVAHTPLLVVPLPCADVVVELFAQATPIIAKTTSPASAARVRTFRMDPSFSPRAAKRRLVPRGL